MTNRPENRLIKATLLKLQKQTTSAENSKEIRQLLTAFETVEASIHYQKDFSQVKTGRMMKDYKIPLEWAKVFLMNESFTTFSGQNHSRALLFPMEKVFESYVAQNVKKIMGLSGWSVWTQHKGRYLFEEPRCFSLRPDIFLKNGTKTVVMDTKWKRLIDNERKNYGIAQADMYQMYAYSKKYNASDIWLLYPLTCEMRGHSDIYFRSDDNITVHVFFVDVENIEDSLQVLCARL